MSKKNISSADFNPSYIGQRDDIVRLIPEPAKNVLDIGCSTGALGQQLKQRNNATVIGIEINQEMAILASTILDKVIIADVEDITFSKHFTLAHFDCIILADILEHLKDPWRVIKNLTTILSNDGTVIVSIPNVRHYSTIMNLVLKGLWPFEIERDDECEHLHVIHEDLHKCRHDSLAFSVPS